MRSHYLIDWLILIYEITKPVTVATRTKATNKMSSYVQTLGSWLRLSFEAWMFASFCACVVLYRYRLIPFQEVLASVYYHYYTLTVHFWLGLGSFLSVSSLCTVGWTPWKVHQPV